MISNIASASPTIPAETSVLGNLSSPDSTSSFADQLASAVGQAGSNPQNTSGSQRQNLDAPAGPKASKCMLVDRLYQVIYLTATFF